MTANKSPQHLEFISLDRRRFLTCTAGALIATCTDPLFARTDPHFWERPRRLWIKTEVRKGVIEEISETYWANGRVVWPGYLAICRLMRDVRADAAVQMSTTLLDILYGMQGWTEMNGRRKVIALTSGYRTKPTNEAVGGKGDSRHMNGAAADIFIPGVSVADMGKLAQHLRGGGVGFYPSKGVVHVDDGDLRSWRS
ncbi:uncharacterized protein YcbK (DUF882 family) [Cupriavidus metallidurans]|uniref:YcbK family protein n=1 Tax=Cupriavidus TaxID=106589 RepID=UPI001F28A942|nr:MULTISPECIES: DUF882 domain-containing protein [Cupriavidus]MDE4922534.1 DUF882 domain-containing protein [Cupriavidus metallidurans]